MSARLGDGAEQEGTTFPPLRDGVNLNDLAEILVPALEDSTPNRSELTEKLRSASDVARSFCHPQFAQLAESLASEANRLDSVGDTNEFELEVEISTLEVLAVDHERQSIRARIEGRDLRIEMDVHINFCPQNERVEGAAFYVVTSKDMAESNRWSVPIPVPLSQQNSTAEEINDLFQSLDDLRNQNENL